jgi:molybdate transport system regulatory protein
MNRIKGHIINLSSFEDLTLLEIEVLNTTIKSIIINDNNFTIGTIVEVLFKETELIISKNDTNLISLQNQFDCVVISIKTGKLLSQITLKYYNIELNSIITSYTIDKLNLVIGDRVVALVKTNEIMVSTC